MAFETMAFAFLANMSNPTCRLVYDDPAPPFAADRSILIAAMMAYEIDTIQMALAEYDGVADVLLTENRRVHNPQARRDKRTKPLIWASLYNRTQFQMQRSTLRYHACTTDATSDDMWAQENADNACVTSRLQLLRPLYDIVVVGSIDEILARSTLMRLKHDQHIGELPASGAIGMPLGLLGRRFRTDWHHGNRPFSFSLPSIWPSSELNPRRHIAPLPGPAVVGGLHATNYCFLPAIILKEQWATEYGHAITNDAICGTPLSDIKRKCYNMLHHRTYEGHSEETVVPQLLQQCPEAFPAWTGDVDPRELTFYRSVCQQSAWNGR